MFTGLVEEIGTIIESVEAAGGRRVRISAPRITPGVREGDSIAVSGCCLTAIEVGSGGFSADLSLETVRKTAPRWTRGARVNLERAMPADGRFGGHIVSGHVEGVGRVASVRREPGAYVVEVEAPERLAAYLIPKGSVTVDGVSLTIVDVGGPGGSDPTLGAAGFTLWLIPHTLQATTLGEVEPGTVVNLEADLIAKYLERIALLKEPANVP